MPHASLWLSQPTGPGWWWLYGAWPQDDYDLRPVHVERMGPDAPDVLVVDSLDPEYPMPCEVLETLKWRRAMTPQPPQPKEASQ